MKTFHNFFSHNIGVFLKFDKNVEAIDKNVEAIDKNVEAFDKNVEASTLIPSLTKKNDKIFNKKSDVCVCTPKILFSARVVGEKLNLIFFHRRLGKKEFSKSEKKL